MLMISSIIQIFVAIFSHLNMAGCRLTNYCQCNNFVHTELHLLYRLFLPLEIRNCITCGHLISKWNFSFKSKLLKVCQLIEHHRPKRNFLESNSKTLLTTYSLFLFHRQIWSVELRGSLGERLREWQKQMFRRNSLPVTDENFNFFQILNPLLQYFKNIEAPLR